MADSTFAIGRFDLGFQEQIDFFRQKLNLPTAAWDDIWQSAHDRAFVVAGATKADLLDDLRQAVEKAIAEGTTLETFRRDFRKIVAARGWHGWTGEDRTGGEAWRTKVIYETNLRTSYAAGREAQLSDPGLQQLLPYRRYVHNESVLHPRPQHLAWHGLTLPHDHPFWKTHSPPNGWGCRCRVTAVAAPKKGDPTAPPDGWDEISEKTGAPVGIDKGWAYQPGASVRDELRDLVKGKVAKLPPPLGKALAANAQAVLAAVKGESFGDVLQIKGSGIAKSAMDVAVPAIDKVHGAPVLPVIPVESSRSGAFQGAYSYRTNTHDAIGIRVSSMSKNPALTALHEIGHFIDHQAINGQKGYASAFDPLLEKWRSAVDGSAATAEISGELVKTKIQRVRNLCGYYLSRHEQWARAYAQYIATRSADPKLLAQLDAIRSSAHAVYRASQWSDEDFAPIGAAIDELLTGLGLKR